MAFEGHTLAELREDYAAARAAWKKAIVAESVNVTGTQIGRPKSKDLQEQMDRIGAEIARRTSSGTSSPSRETSFGQVSFGSPD